MKTAFRFLWITDPWETLDHPKDTTLRLAEEAIALGAESFWCDVRSIRVENGETRLDARRILTVYPGRSEKSFRLDDPKPMAPSEFDSLHYRTDPPVDLAFLQPVQLLALGLPRGGKAASRQRRAELVNPAAMLAVGNEKLEPTLIPGLMPPSLASSQWERLRAFGREEGRTVLKPLHQAQSKGIELLDWQNEEGVSRARASIEAATLDFTLPVVLQRYLPGIADGEKRLWFVDGELLATIRKLPLPNDFRVNMDGGSRLAPAELDAQERKSASRIGKHLVARGIRLAAVDLIDGYATDFNFTSPGLIPQMEGVTARNLARPIIQALMQAPRKPR